MKTLFSKTEDCRQLIYKIYSDLGKKMSIYGTINEVPNGHYHVASIKEYGSDFKAYEDDAVQWSIKCLDGHFIRVTISDITHPVSKGLKLATLSDFCAAIAKHYGMPSFFYTIQGDDENSVNLQWSFDHVDEDLAALREGTYFDDAEVAELIEFKKPTNPEDEQKFANCFRITGLPYELLDLVITNGPDFLLSKDGKRIKKREEKKDAREFN